jgi:hypothetical protein
MQARLYGALVEIARERASLRTLQLNQVTTS